MSAWKKQANAGSYVEGVRGAIPLIAEQIDLMHRIIDVSLPSVTDLLDLGCGDGALADSVLSRHPNASAVLVDFSEPMLARAMERFEGRTHPPVIVHADLAERAWSDCLPAGGSYDLVVSGYAIHHLDDIEKQALFRNVFDLLRPGGLFLNLEHVASMNQMGRELFDELFIDSLFEHALLGDPAAERSEVAAAYHGREDQHDNYLAPVENQCRWMRDIGFVDVDCYFKILELALLAGRRPV